MADFSWLVPHFAEDVSRPASALFHVLSSRPGPFELRGSGGISPTGIQLSEQTSFGGRVIYTGSVGLRDLKADAIYNVDLCASGQATIFDRARVRTMPDDIGGEKSPLRIFLGSCFSQSTATPDGNHVLGLHEVLRNDPPHLKFLCGDQVYLDIPVHELIPHELGAMQRFVLNKYLANWGALGRASSWFGSLLRIGSSIFMSDDHEFWNNYPNTAIYAPSLFDDDRRRAFKDAAHKALTLFQRVPPSMRVIQVGRGKTQLTLIAIDGRVHRGEDRAHRIQDLERLHSTLRTCPGPAVIVLSQPLFDGAHRSRLKRWFSTHITDLALADFEDYRELVLAIAACPHDVCVLSGDIHGGRISAQRGAQHTVYEVIASPLSLVGPAQAFGGKLPENEYPDLEGTHAKYRVQEQPRYGPIQRNHGALLSFSRIGRDYKVYVRYVGAGGGENLVADEIKTTFTLRSKP
jgi:hypothetical protein